MSDITLRGHRDFLHFRVVDLERIDLHPVFSGVSCRLAFNVDADDLPGEAIRGRRGEDEHLSRSGLLLRRHVW